MRKRIILFCGAFILLSIISFLFWGYYLDHIEYEVDYNVTHEVYYLEIDGRSLFCTKGGFLERWLYTEEFEWDFGKYSAVPVRNELEAIKVASGIMDNLTLNGKSYGTSEYLPTSIAHDDRYNVWIVSFQPPEYVDEQKRLWETEQAALVSSALTVILRGTDGKILYIGYL